MRGEDVFDQTDVSVHGHGRQLRTYMYIKSGEPCKKVEYRDRYRFRYRLLSVNYMYLVIKNLGLRVILSSALE